MYSNQQYEKDLKFIEKYENMLSDKREFTMYLIGLAACLMAHVLYLVLFFSCKVRVMVIFNICSVIFYVLMLILAFKVQEKIYLVYASIIEIIIHAAVATVCVGCKPDFSMFLLMIIPLTFFMPVKNKAFPFVVLFVSLALYGVLRYIFHDPANALYDIENSDVATVLYVINIVIGTFVLVYVTFISTLYNRYTDSKLRVQNEQLRVLASVDPLTKLLNRRAMNEELKNISKASGTSRISYFVGLGDIDDFKMINDTYGHDFGDVVLQSIAGIIQSKVPEGGFVSRWGGEEFLFVIPETDMDAGVKISEDIIQTVRENEFVKFNNSFAVTMTIGTSEGLPDDYFDKVITRADNRLYKGKNSGKNCVVKAD